MVGKAMAYEAHVINMRVGGLISGGVIVLTSVSDGVIFRGG